MVSKPFSDIRAQDIDARHPERPETRMSLDEDEDVIDYLDDLLDRMFEERLIRGRRDTRARKEFARWLGNLEDAMEKRMNLLVRDTIEIERCIHGLRRVCRSEEHVQEILNSVKQKWEIEKKLSIERPTPCPSFAELLRKEYERACRGELD